ncbi:MAG TPA: ThiF family adenylyltransferase [Xanthomonadales bacterium]|nr:ThiF family adenylyltransferase [Xanthomonadales bacterium]
MRTAEQGRKVEPSGRLFGEIPHLNFYDLSQPAGVRDLTIALKKARGRRLVSPGAMFADRTEKKAKREGIYRDRYEIFSRDSIALGHQKDHWDDKEEELAQKIAEDDDPKKFLVVEYPWEHYGRFNKIHRQPELERVLQSRNFQIISEAAQEANKTETTAVIGQGVGSPVTLKFTLAGARSLIIADGGIVTPHDGNRQWGPLIRSIGENHAIYTAKQALQLNPFLNIDCIPQNVSMRDVPGTYPLARIVNNAGFIFDEMDSLLDKADLRFLAREAGKPVGQITDLGKGVAIQFDDPRTGKYPCNGRLTPDVYEELQKANLKDFDIFMYFAVNIFMGVDNITPEVERAFRESRENGFYHIPQSGIAASKAGAAAFELYEAYHEAREIPAEKLIGYDWAA